MPTPTTFRSRLLRRLLLLSLLAAPVPAQPAAGDRPESYGLVLVVDGAKGDVWRRKMEAGELPETRRLFLDQGLWVDQVTSPFPTITGAGMPSVLTGNLPSRHGIPSLYFFERKTRQYPVLYVALEALDWNRWLSPDVQTIWEHFPGPDDALAMGPALTRGADKHFSILWNLGYKAIEIRSMLELKKRQLKRFFFGGPPARITVLYNGWFDHMEHVHGVEGPKMDAHYRAIDHLLGEAVRTFEAVVATRERELGRPVEKFVTLVSDHGHQEVREVLSIDKWVREKKGARVMDKIWTQLFGQKVQGRLPDDLEDREVVLAAGEGHALLYFPTPVVDPSGARVQRLEWSRRPTLGELRDYPFRDTRLDLVAEAVQTPAVSFALAKDRSSGKVHVFSRGGEATLERRGDLPTRADYRYIVVTGGDPLGFDAHPGTRPLLDGEFHPAEAWFQATLETDYPDAAVQLYQAFDVEDRAPDLYLSAAPYVSIGDLVDGEKSASKHGGLTRDESWATLAFHGTGITRGRLPAARNVDMVPTMLDLLGVGFDPDSKDGRVLPVRGPARPVLPVVRADGPPARPVPVVRRVGRTHPTGLLGLDGTE